MDSGKGESPPMNSMDQKPEMNSMDQKPTKKQKAKKIVGGVVKKLWQPVKKAAGKIPVVGGAV